MNAALIVSIALLLLLVALGSRHVVKRRLREPRASDQAAREILDLEGSPVTDAAVTFVSRYLDRRSSLRWRSAVIAVVAVNIVRVLVMHDPKINIDLYTIMGAYAVGTLIAELGLTRPRGAVARAGLDVRSLDGYLEPAWIWCQRITTGAAVILTVSTPLAASGSAPSAIEAGLISVAIGLVGALAEWGQRRIVSNAQPGNTPDVTAADDVVRRASVRSIGGVTIGFVTLSASGAVAVLANSIIPVVVGVVAGLGLWYRCARPSRRTRRSIAVSAALGLLVIVTFSAVLVVARTTQSDSGDVGPAAPVDGAPESTLVPTTETGS